MKQISKNLLIFGGLAAGSIVYACTKMPMPPMILDVSVAAISDAAAAGYSNPSRAAALMELDSQASALMGATTWFQGGFDGNVTYRTKIGPVTHVVT